MHQFTMEIFESNSTNGSGGVTLGQSVTMNVASNFVGFVNFNFASQNISWCNDVRIGWRLRCLKDTTAACSGRSVNLCAGKSVHFMSQKKIMAQFFFSIFRKNKKKMFLLLFFAPKCGGFFCRVCCLFCMVGRELKHDNAKKKCCLLFMCVCV